MFNKLVRLRNRAENAWAQVDVQLRKRYDLIPNLVETVKGYAAARARDVRGGHRRRAPPPSRRRASQQQAQAENVLTAALGRLFAVAEAYPQLRATENFQQLQAQLSDVEQNIAVARQVYNDTVLSYDNALETVPTNIIAGIFNFKPREYFQTEEATREAPRVAASARPGCRATAARRPRLPSGGAGVARPPSPSPAAEHAMRAGARSRHGGARRARAACCAAAASAYYLPAARVAVKVAPDGSLLVTEHITIAGAFHGAYRDIPLRKGESIDRIHGRARTASATRAAAAPKLGSIDTPGHVQLRPHRARRCGSSGTSRRPGEPRTFTVAYRFRGLAVAYDDVVDVNLKVWGSNWSSPLGDLTASMTLPRPAPLGPALPRLGPPAWVNGVVDPHAARPRSLRAVNVPSHQFVELRVVFPRGAADARPRGAKVVDGQRPGEDRQGGGRRPRPPTSATSEQIDDAKHHIGRTLLYLAPARRRPGARWSCCSSGSSTAASASTGYDREYEQEPPTDTEPALVPPLLRQDKAAGSHEFTATLFDLIRRGRYKSTPVNDREEDLGRPPATSRSPTCCSTAGRRERRARASSRSRSRT